MNAGKVVLGVMAGIAAGAVLCILFAPEKGSDTRKKICRKKEELGDSLKDKFDEFVDGISQKFEEVKSDISDLTGKEHAKNADEKRA